MRVPGWGRGRSWTRGHAPSRPPGSPWGGGTVGSGSRPPPGPCCRGRGRCALGRGEVFCALTPRQVLPRLHPRSWMRGDTQMRAHGRDLRPPPCSHGAALGPARGAGGSPTAPAMAPQRVVGAGSPAGSGLSAPRGRPVLDRRETVSGARAPGLPPLPRSRSRGGRRGGRIRRRVPARVVGPRGALERVRVRGAAGPFAEGTRGIRSASAGRDPPAEGDISPWPKTPRTNTAAT